MPVDAEKLKSKAQKRSIGENDDKSSNAEPPRKRSKAMRLPTDDEDAKYVETKRALKKYSADKTSEMLRVIKFAFKAPPFKLELPVYLRYSSYQLSSYRDRCQLLKDNSELTRINVEPNIITLNAHLNLLERIRDDPELNTYYEYQETENKDLGRCMRFIAQRIVMARTNNNLMKHLLAEQGTSTEITPESLQEYFPAYEPPKNRIRIKSNLTFNENDVIPVYSDLEGETLESLEIPVTLTYDYTDVNMVDQFTEPNLTKAIIMSEENGENMIRCTCCSSKPIVPCYENEKCPCFIMNQRMQGFQIPREGCGKTEFTSFKPIYFFNPKDHYYDHAGFACSELCGCGGKCTNNSMLLPHKKLFPLEIYRNDPAVGFVVRSTVMIPAGTPLMEFTGEIVELKNMELDNRDYAYQITYSDDVKFRRLLQEVKFSKEYTKLLEKLSRKRFFIDPKIHGNVARTVGHACAPNMEVVRVFQKSLSPAHLHLVLVTLEDVFPSVPLTIDYGKTYTDVLKDRCRCRTFACRRGEHVKTYKNFETAQLAHCLKKIHDTRYDKWNKDIGKEDRDLAKKK
ncbi:SET domain-containing protein [Caenorhabditis elegans]|uniref:SET domain-containing protein n=1 Tax=Caenorhabditis elegans TaxID=6239 RepID=Q966C5_CAEEL|nr:SET domain-containing protein [Caenorhabditis elegans]CCD71897.1 SET domain-containing protein [Caenorhabditis elegans]|eukprot:NP_500555.2 SET (trithorax/polycomb) domain containing [Caenorhabditis elegans]